MNLIDKQNNRIICVASVTMRFIRSSNSPRNFVPAITFVRSKDKILLFLRILGILPSAILCARPSTIAVLPTWITDQTWIILCPSAKDLSSRRSIFTFTSDQFDQASQAFAFLCSDLYYTEAAIYSPAPSSISPPSEIASLYSFFALLKSIPAVTKISV